jgi:hypothetical protein
MRYSSHDELIHFRLQLDFANERLNFNLFTDLGYTDSGTAESADAISEVARFSKEYFGNGQLHIVDAESGQLIARKDAFIPMNMYQDDEAADRLIARWKQLANDRRDRDRRYGDEITRHAQSYQITFR